MVRKMRLRTSQISLMTFKTYLGSIVVAGPGDSKDASLVTPSPTEAAYETVTS